VRALVTLVLKMMERWAEQLIIGGKLRVPKTHAVQVAQLHHIQS